MTISGSAQNYRHTQKMNYRGGEETAHRQTHTHIGLVEIFWKFQNETGLEHTDAKWKIRGCFNTNFV